MKRQTPVAIAKFATGLVLIILIARQIELGKLGARLIHADLTSLLLACITLAIAVVANALRWSVITSYLGHPIGPSSAIAGYFEAMFFNQILPTGLGGDAVRALRAYEAGSSLGLSTLGVLIDRAYGILSVALIVLLAAAVGRSPITQSSIFTILVLASLVIAGGAAVTVALGAVIAPERLPKFAQPLAWSMQWFSLCTRSFSVTGRLAPLLAAGNMMSILCLWYCAKSVGVSLSLWDALVFTQAFALSAVIPLSIVGWGVREAVAIPLLQPLAVGATDATAVSVTFGVVLTIFAIVGAAGWMLTSYRRLKDAPATSATR